MPDTIKHCCRRWFQFGLGTMLVVMTLVVLDRGGRRMASFTTPDAFIVVAGSLQGRPTVQIQRKH